MDQESHLDRTIRWMNHGVRVCMANDAFVGAMTQMMAHISALAGYYAGRTTERPKSDHDEFMKFYKAYFTVFPDILPPSEGRRKRFSMIYSHFRNGLMHEHLMKNGTAIDQGLSKPAFYIDTRSGNIVLNVDHFFYDYLRALGDYSNDVKKNKSEIQKLFIDRSKYLGALEPYI